MSYALEIRECLDAFRRSNSSTVGGVVVRTLVTLRYLIPIPVGCNILLPTDVWIYARRNIVPSCAQLRKLSRFRRRSPPAVRISTLVSFATLFPPVSRLTRDSLPSPSTPENLHCRLGPSKKLDFPPIPRRPGVVAVNCRDIELDN